MLRRGGVAQTLQRQQPVVQRLAQLGGKLRIVGIAVGHAQQPDEVEVAAVATAVDACDGVLDSGQPDAAPHAQGHLRDLGEDVHVALRRIHQRLAAALRQRAVRLLGEVAARRPAAQAARDLHLTDVILARGRHQQQVVRAVREAVGRAHLRPHAGARGLVPLGENLAAGRLHAHGQLEPVLKAIRPVEGHRLIGLEHILAQMRGIEGALEPRPALGGRNRGRQPHAQPFARPELQRHRIGALACRDLLHTHQERVRSRLQGQLEGHALRQLVVEVLLPVDVRTIQPHVGRAVRREGARHRAKLGFALRRRADDLRIGPRGQVGRLVVEHGQVDVVVVPAAHVVPLQCGLACGEWLRLRGRLGDAGSRLVVVPGNLELVVCAGEAAEVRHHRRRRPGHQPVVDVPARERIVEVRDVHDPPSGKP